MKSIVSSPRTFFASTSARVMGVVMAIVAVFVFGINWTSAQVPTPPLPPDVETTAEPTQSVVTPQIYVTDYTLTNRNFKQGDVVTGSFTLYNNSVVNAPEVRYELSLVGNYIKGLATTQFDVIQNQPLYLAAGEKKVISFRYALPKNISGSDLGIHVEAILGQNLHMGWDDLRISVSGSSSYVSINNSALRIGGKYYPSGSGPVVPKEGSVDYSVVFQNATKSVATFTPHVKIFFRSTEGKLLKEYDDAAVTVGVGEIKTVHFKLPTFDDAPGVYVGEMRFIDSTNQAIAPLGIFRYIIMGTIGTIQSVTSDSTSARENGVVNVTLTYAGVPFDQFSGTENFVGNATLSVSLLNDQNQKIGSVTREVPLDVDKQTIVIPVSVTSSSMHIAISANLKKDETLLSTYSVSLTPKAVNTGPVSTVAEESNGFLLPIIVIVALVFIIGLILIMIKMFHSNKPPTTGGTSPSGTVTGTLIAILLIVGGVWTFSAYRALVANAYVETSTESLNTPTWPKMHVFVNSPQDLQNITPGSTFYINGNTIYYACDNWTSGTVSINATFEGVTKTFTSTSGTSASLLTNPILYADGTYGGTIGPNFIIGPFVAPATAGVHRIAFTNTVNALYHGVDTAVNRSTGYIDITVTGSAIVAPVVTGSTPPDGTGSGGGTCTGVIDLSWNTVAGAVNYDVYRDAGVVPIATVVGPNHTYRDMGISPNTSHTYYVIARNGISNSPASNSITKMASGCLPLSVNVSPTPASPGLGDTVNWAASSTGGQPPYTYSWSGSVTGTKTTQNINETYNTSGTKTVTVSVTSNDGQHTTDTATVSIPVSNTFTSISCSPSKTSAFVGDTVTWTANPLPVSGTYVYVWSGDDNLSGATKTISKVYSTVGVKTARVDIVGVGVSPDCTSTVTIKAKPQFQEF